MLLGSYMAVMEVRMGEESNTSLFDKTAFLYIYLEPTISGTIVLLAFTNHRSYLIKSYQILHKIIKTLEQQGLKMSMLYIKVQTRLFVAVFVVGNFLWNLQSYCNGKSALHSFYEYLGWGISFHAQQVLLIYFVLHIKMSHGAINLLNKHLMTLNNDDANAMEKLSQIGAMHFELCKSLGYMVKICSPTILLFSMRSYFVLCCSLMSLNGMLPKMKSDFFILAWIYVVTTVQFVLRSETVYKEASVPRQQIL